MPDPVLDVLDVLERLQGEIPVGRIVPRKNPHVTLVFLDEQSVQLLEALHHDLAEIKTLRCG